MTKPKPQFIRACRQCGRTFVTARDRKVFCSRVCCIKHQNAEVARIVREHRYRRMV